MKILLISPKSTTGGLESLRKGNQILQGLLYVAAAAKAAGHKVTVVIADKHNVDRYIRRYQPDVLAVSCVTSTYPIIRDLLIHVKQRHPKLKTIIGGHHATFMYKEVYHETKVDYICRGEGEEVFPQLLAELEKGNVTPEIMGIVYYRDSRFWNDEQIVIMQDIEHLPMITRDLTAPEFSFSPKIVSSRGCPFACSFCSISAFYGGSYRKRSVETVIAEIKEYLSWGYADFWFHDDNLTVDAAWMHRFCEMIIAEKLRFTYSCMSRVDTICGNPDLFAKMAATGCKFISIGIESGIPEVLKRMHKNISLAQIKQAVKIMNRIKLSHNWYMILGTGDEFDTPAYLKQNIKFFCSLPLDFVLISILTPFPGTELFNKLKAENRLRHYNWEDYDILHCVYQPLGIGYAELEKMLPRAYLKVYLSKGWRLLPFIIKSVRNNSITPKKIGIGLWSLIQQQISGRDFSRVLQKQGKNKGRV